MAVMIPPIWRFNTANMAVMNWNTLLYIFSDFFSYLSIFQRTDRYQKGKKILSVEQTPRVSKKLKA